MTLEEVCHFLEEAKPADTKTIIDHPEYYFYTIKDFEVFFKHLVSNGIVDTP
jgi:hypothetical protein